MLLESIEVHNLRNLSGEVFWGDGLNIILGDNAQGKTNWLEAIYLLATTKSFRTQRPQEAIRFGEDLAVVRGRVTRSPSFRARARSGSAVSSGASTAHASSDASS